MLIDIGPMRRDIVRQFVPEGQWEKLTDEERRRIMTEVNQRMLGIAQGIQLGTAEAQKRVAEAQRAADAKAQAAAAAAEKAAKAAKGAGKGRVSHGVRARDAHGVSAHGTSAQEDGALRNAARRDARTRR